MAFFTMKVFFGERVTIDLSSGFGRQHICTDSPKHDLTDKDVIDIATHLSLSQRTTPTYIGLTYPLLRTKRCPLHNVHLSSYRNLYFSQQRFELRHESTAIKRSIAVLELLSAFILGIYSMILALETFRNQHLFYYENHDVDLQKKRHT